jgi:streptogramin lyase
MFNKKRGLKMFVSLTTMLLVGVAIANFAFGVTIWKFSDGSSEKTIQITTSPGSNSDAKMTIPLGAVVENIKLKVKQKVFSTKYIWVPLSYYSTGNDKIAQIKVSDGSLVQLWDSGNNPSRLAVSPDGNEVWVANRDSANVTKIDVSSGSSTNYSVMGGPRAVTFDRDGNVWVGGGGTVMKLDRNGNRLLTLNPNSNQPYLGTFTYGADTDPDGYVWFVGRGNGKVTRIDPNNCSATDPNDGSKTTCDVDTFTGFENLYGMGIDSKGDVWVAGSWAHKMFHIEGSRSGNVGTVHSIDFSERVPRGIAVDSQDNIWFSDWANNEIVKYNPSSGSIENTYSDPNASGPLGISISIEEEPTGSGNFVEYVWVVNYYSSDATKLRISDGSIIGTYCVESMAALPSFVSGKYGNGISFDGVDDYVEVPDSASLDITDAITIEAWIYYKEYDTYPPRVVAKSIGWSGSGTSYHFGVRGSPYNYLETQIATSVAQYGLFGSEVIPLDKWTHITFTYDGSTMRHYVNGILDTEGSASGTINITSSTLKIGTLGGRYFNGTIDEVRIYNRALSSTEIEEHYNNIFNNNADLIGYWNFNEESGTIANDSSGNNNHGILLSSCSSMRPYNYSNMTGFRGPITELDIGNDGTKEWSVASYVSEAELNSASVASVLTSLASDCTCPGCSLSGGDCTIDFTFSSTNQGTIELSSLRAEAPGLLRWFGYTPPPGEQEIKGVETDLEKAVMNITNFILGFIGIIAVLAMISAGVLSIAAGATLDPKLGWLSKKVMYYVLLGLAITGIAYAIIRAVVTAGG